MSATMTKKLEAVEMWFYQRIERSSYTKHITNEEVLSRMATTRNLIIAVRGRQMSFFGHVMRNNEIESFSISGIIEGKRCSRRQRIIYTKSLSEWMKVEETEMIRASKDREMWKTMATKAWTRHGKYKKKKVKYPAVEAEV